MFIKGALSGAGDGDGDDGSRDVGFVDGLCPVSAVCRATLVTPCKVQEEQESSRASGIK